MNMYTVHMLMDRFMMALTGPFGWVICLLLIAIGVALLKGPGRNR